MSKIYMKPAEALEKLMAYCSKMERCKFDVIKKTRNWGISQADADKIIAQLTENGFINEERYIESYIRGKYHYNKWGRVKIKYNLKFKDFDDEQIDKALDAIISENDYEELIQEQIRKKNASLKIDDEYQRKSKLIRFAQSRGYETELALSAIDNL